MRPEKRGTLRELAGLFLRLGTTAFGGPAAHIALMENEVVRQRHWLTKEEFLDLLGLCNLIPGPSSTEMAIFIGYRRASWRGLILGGLCFILPAALIVTVLAWVYMKFGKLPQVAGFLYGIKPIIIAVVLQALWSLSRTAIKTKLLGIVGLLAIGLSYVGVNPLTILFGIGSLMAIIHSISRRTGTVASLTPVVGLAIPSSVAPGSIVVPFSLWKLFFFFLKIGSVLFGSGYVLLAFLRSDLVEHWHWLTENQLLDAVAVGQFTPGPVFTTATFIGYILGGPGAALVATVGIFLPSFVLVAIGSKFVPALRQSPITGAFLDGVNVASLALMAVVTWQLGTAAIVSWPTGLLALTAAFLLFRYRVNSAWLVLGGAGVGLLLKPYG